MRILVYPRDLDLGGSSINAVDLAASVRDRGHNVAVVGRPGPLSARIEAAGLPWLPLDVPVSPRPSPAAIRVIARTVRRQRIDLVHTYEFWTCVEGFYGCLGAGVPVVGTVMTMGLAGYLPRSVPLTVGYRDLLDEAARGRGAPVHLLEPPVDTTVDRPGVDPTEFLERHRLERGTPLVVIVSRAARHMKQEGIERTMDAVGTLAARIPAQLVVVGGGSALDVLRERAGKINAQAGRTVVHLTGPMDDPSQAYAAADVVVGMGSSILRGMAYGKPGVVVGEQGFSAVVGPDTLATFDRTGFYGVGARRPEASADPLLDQIGSLLQNPAARAAAGAFGADLVARRFSLGAMTDTLEAVYAGAIEEAPGALGRGLDAVGTTARVIRHKVTGRLGRRRASGA